MLDKQHLSDYQTTHPYLYGNIPNPFLMGVFYDRDLQPGAI